MFWVWVCLKSSFVFGIIFSDDEFYDRTNKRKQRSNKAETTQVVETAETLLEKRDVLAKEMDVVSAELEAEKAKSSTKEESNITSESIDPLDAFMSTVSTKIGMSFVLERAFLHDSFRPRMLMHFVFKE